MCSPYRIIPHDFIEWRAAVRRWLWDSKLDFHLPASNDNYTYNKWPAKISTSHEHEVPHRGKKYFSAESPRANSVFYIGKVFCNCRIRNIWKDEQRACGSSLETPKFGTFATIGQDVQKICFACLVEVLISSRVILHSIILNFYWNRTHEMHDNERWARTSILFRMCTCRSPESGWIRRWDESSGRSWACSTLSWWSGGLVCVCFIWERFLKSLESASTKKTSVNKTGPSWNSRVVCGTQNPVPVWI